MLKLRIALRYLLSRKQFGAVNVISAISVAAVAVAAAAMIIVLSVFNGFERLAQSKLSALDPDYLAVPTQGKRIEGIGSLVDLLEGVDGVKAACPQISERAYAMNAEAQSAVVMLGLTERGLQESGIADVIIDGTDRLTNDSTVLTSVGVAMALGVRPYEDADSMSLFEPRRTGAINPANPMAAFRKADLRVAGVYQVEQEEYDRDMVIVAYSLASRLLGYDDAATAVAIHTDGSRAPESDLRQIAEQHGLTVKDRYEQQEHTYRMIAIEKWISFLMLGFILVIASANIISTLSMLVLDKEPSMAILRAMGATRGLIRGVFATQGWLIVLLGGLAGIACGVLLVAGQMRYGWVKLGASNPELMSITNYPVELRWGDVGFTLAALTGVALLLTPVVGMVVKGRDGDNDSRQVSR